MTYKWYFIFNRTEFQALNLVSRTYTVILDGIGQKDILVTRGNLIGLTYEGVFLPIEQTDKNPFALDDLAVHVHANGNVFLGFLQPEEET